MQSTRHDTIGASAYNNREGRSEGEILTSTIIAVGTGGSEEVLLDVTVDDPEVPSDRAKERIRLVRGGVKHTSDKMVEVHVLPATRVSVLKTERAAVGYLLGFLEQHSIENEAARNLVGSAADLESFDAWRESLTQQDRRDRMFECAEEHERDPSVAKAMKKGRWRETELTRESRDLIREIAAKTERNGRRCYETAQRAIGHVWDNDRVEYCEGYALPYHGVRGTRHAWIEVDGAVVELTWLWHAPVDARAQYYGTAIPRDVLAERMGDDERGHDPMILDETEFKELQRLIEKSLEGYTRNG